MRSQQATRPDDSGGGESGYRHVCNNMFSIFTFIRKFIYLHLLNFKTFIV